MPRVVGKVRRTRPVEVDDLRFLRSHTDRTIKITLPGPFTMSQQAANEFYDDEAELAMDLAVAVSEEVHDLFEAGADIVQLDEPWLQSRADKAREFALPAIDRALPAPRARPRCTPASATPTSSTTGRPATRSSPSSPTAPPTSSPSRPPSPSSTRACSSRSRARRSSSACSTSTTTPRRDADEVARRIEAALTVIPEERLQVGPDCGMKYLPRDVAFGKLRALVEGARLATG